MESYQDTVSQRKFEQWLRRRDDVIDGIGFMTISVMSAGLLEPGTPNVEAQKPTNVDPESRRQLANASLQLLRVDRPTAAKVYTEEAIFGRSA